MIGYDAILLRLDEHTKRFKEHDKKFNKILAEVRYLRARAENINKRLRLRRSLGLR